LGKLKKIIIFIFLTCILPFTSAQTNNSNFKEKIDSILSAGFFSSTISAVKVFDLSKSKLLYEKNSKLLLRPASNLKLFTTAAALLFLGTDFHFKTNAYYSGQILNDTLYGNIYLKGGFDPFFNIGDLDSMISDIKKLNIKSIKGNIYADVSNIDSLYWGKGWMWDDAADATIPYLSSLNINENKIQVFTEPQEIDYPAIVTFYPESNYYSSEVNVKTIKEDTSKLETTSDWINRKNKIYVNGFQSVDGNIDSSEINIFHPEILFINLFKEHLIKNGILFSGQLDTISTPERVILFSEILRNIDSVIVKTNKESSNLGAEMLLYLLAEKFYGLPATVVNGIKLIDSLITLTGNDPKKFRIVDGSGVSHYNLVSSELILDLLKYMYYHHSELIWRYINSLPIAGVDGLLKTRMQDGPAYNNVRAKTGTLSGVSSISGYLNAQNGDKLSFSILMENFVGSSKPVRAIQDSLLTIFSLFNEE